MATKKAAKKSNIKKAAITKAQATKAEPKRTQTKDRNPRSKDALSLDDVISSINKEQGMDVIRRAAEMETMYILRRPTGITSLDIALAGGAPASSTIVLVGPDGAGKDYLLWRSAAEVQEIYGDDFCMAIFLTEFKADKPFMRDLCGLKIAFSPKELDEYSMALERLGRPPLTEERREELQTQVGEILIIDGVTAEKGFDAVIRLVASNRCQMLVINSIGSLQTEAKEEQESFEDFARQASEATLISKFMPKLAMTLNNDRNGRNETSLYIVNQMRAKRDAAPVRGRPKTEKDTYEPGSKSWALKHGKAIEIALHKGPPYKDAADGSTVGRKIRWELTKGKLGTHDGKKGEVDFFYDGGVDVLADLINVCKSLGLIEGGSYPYYEHPEFGFKVHGAPELRRKLQNDPALAKHLRAEAFKRAGVVYRWR